MKTNYDKIMRKLYTKEELVQKVLSSQKIELQDIYPSEGLYLHPDKEPRAVYGYVINNLFFADKYSGDIFSIDDPYLTDIENMDEFDF
ncbi:MAG: hypothetical protein IJF12_02130 [Alphaproteobacteria bacterium]|nr:hypothetical protein [Alphaproteobacteria bacterium]